MDSEEIKNKEHPFILPDNHYKRDLNFTAAYIKDAALYTSIMKDRDYEDCLSAAKLVASPKGAHPVKDPAVEYIDNSDEGNPELKVTSMSEYMRIVHENKYIMSTTLAVNYNPDQRESELAKYCVGEYANRKANKDKMMEYSKVGDSVNQAIYNNRQNRNKIKLNSISGAHGSKHSAISMAGGHPMLTGICRSGTSNTNSTIERYLCGNRHYYDKDVVIQDILSIIRLTDMDLVEKAMTQYNLHYPTAEETLALVFRSTSLYWESSDGSLEAEITELVTKLTPLQRAAYTYVNDMYALRVLNDKFTRDIFTSLLDIDEKLKVTDVPAWINKIRGDEFNLIGITSHGHVKLSKFDGEGIAAASDEDREHLALMSYGVYHNLNNYKLFYRAFWLTKNMPPNMAEFPDSIRRSAIASDTDSAIFTTQDWVKWYYGELVTCHNGLKMAAAVTYLCSQITQHVLVQMTRNLGCHDKHIREFQMKNEFLFKFFSLTSMSKHYFGTMDAQEGVLYENPKWEFKGANLKNSKAPKDIMDRSDEIIKEIGMAVLRGDEIDMASIVQEIANKEHDIIESIRKGDSRYLTTVHIKGPDGYKTANSPYLQYSLWNDSFGDSYGRIPPPPYTALKLNLQLDSRKKMQDWIDGLEDRNIAKGITEWLKVNNKDKFGTMALPIEIVEEKGIPPELMEVTELDTIIMGIMRSYYLILESLGYFAVNAKNSRLLYKELPRSQSEVSLLAA